MRAKEFLIERSIPQMKSDIIKQVQTSSDEDLIQKLYSILNKSGLTGRIAPVLNRDTDTKGYVDQIVEIIINTPGTYEEKVAFINEYPNGYIDVKRMLSGDLVTFDDLIVGGKGAPLRFVHRVFDALKQVTFGGAKGPGEFGLAVLSPHIKITGKGDLNIGKRVIEVKANAGKSATGGGRVGTPGLLNYEKIPDYLDSYGIVVPEGENLNLKQLYSTMQSVGLKPAQQKSLATKMFNYIFKGEADVSAIVDAVTSGKDPAPAYLKANYEVYQKESGFTGMMLMNFHTSTLKYFIDPLQMANEIYAFSIYLISSNQGFRARYVLSQVNLKPVKEPTNPVKAKKVVKQQPAQPQTPPVSPSRLAAGAANLAATLRLCGCSPAPSHL
jgi:hypothetical protein